MRPARRNRRPFPRSMTIGSARASGSRLSSSSTRPNDTSKPTGVAAVFALALGPQEQLDVGDEILRLAFEHVVRRRRHLVAQDLEAIVCPIAQPGPVLFEIRLRVSRRGTSPASPRTGRAAPCRATWDRATRRCPGRRRPRPGGPAHARGNGGRDTPRRFAAAWVRPAAPAHTDRAPGRPPARTRRTRQTPAPRAPPRLGFPAPAAETAAGRMAWPRRPRASGHAATSRRHRARPPPIPARTTSARPVRPSDRDTTSTDRPSAAGTPEASATTETCRGTRGGRGRNS